jgi:hypothetical protein
VVAVPGDGDDDAPDHAPVDHGGVHIAGDGLAGYRNMAVTTVAMVASWFD